MGPGSAPSGCQVGPIPTAHRGFCDVTATVTVCFRGGAREGGSLDCAGPTAPPPGDVRSPRHVGTEEIRSGAGGGGGDLLGLLLLLSLAAQVAEGAELSAPPGAEAGASAGPDELSIERPGARCPALGPWPAPPPSVRCCPACPCIKDLSEAPHRPPDWPLEPSPAFPQTLKAPPCLSRAPGVQDAVILGGPSSDCLPQHTRPPAP